MFTEKSKLVDKRDNPFYGSYKENNILEERHWQNKRHRQQLAMVSGVVIILVLLSIGITLAITLPSVLEQKTLLDPPDPVDFLGPSQSILRQFPEAGVSSDSRTCSEVGRDILQTKGGSAVDAAVAVTLCIGVTCPQSSGLGGGLFMVIYDGNGTTGAINARETAPDTLDPSLYQDNLDVFLTGGLAVGVPGELAGLWEAHQRFGKVQWSELVRPAKDLALNGFSVSPVLARTLDESRERIKADPGLSSEFLNSATGDVWKEGELMTRPRLAKTLGSIETEGMSALHNGTLSQQIANEISSHNGIITVDDLAAYVAEWVDPIEYKVTGNLTMFSLPFPSSGPIIALGLGILDGFGRKNPRDLNHKELGLDTHELAEALKFAQAHQAIVADPNFSNMSQWAERLLTPEYASELRAKIDLYKTFTNPEHYGAFYSPSSSSSLGGTAHISIIGPDGDAVSITSSINLPFGSGFMGESTGIIYNNHMADFTLGNSSDIYGLPQNENNRIEPGKRPRSAMSPLVFINSSGSPVFSTGASGGDKIIPALISTTWRALYRDSDLKTAIDFPRFMPVDSPSQVLLYEYGLPEFVLNELRRRGHKMRRLDNTTLQNSAIGHVNSVCRTKRGGIILGNADYRKQGDSAGF